MRARNRVVWFLACLVVLGAITVSAAGPGLAGMGTREAFAATSHPGEHDNRRGPTAAGEVLPPDRDPDESNWYLKATSRVVIDNDAALDASIDSAIDAMAARDAASLKAMIHPSEGDQTAFASALAAKYPVVLTSSAVSTVNIYCTESTTMYFGYRVVTWCDGGIVSQHTVPVILRFVDGQWWITSRAHNAPTLTFVQSVQH